jgi:hypothetical protein
LKNIALITIITTIPVSMGIYLFIMTDGLITMYEGITLWLFSSILYGVITFTALYRSIRRGLRTPKQPQNIHREDS